MRVLITRPRAQATELGAALQRAGHEPIYFPVIEIRPAEDLTPLQKALTHLEYYAWVVFTSTNAVEVVLEQNSAPFSSQKTKIAAVGQKTAEALRQRGINPDFVPETFTGLDILPGLGELREQWVLLPRADLARPDLPRAIANAGGIPHEIVVYHTIPAVPDPAGLTALHRGVNFVTFTSPSTVENFCSLVIREGLDPQNLPGQPIFACIGPVTAAAAREHHLAPLCVASEHTTKGLVDAIEEWKSERLKVEG